MGCVECDDMPQGIVGCNEEEEDDVIKFRGEWEQLSKQEEDWLEYVKTWPEPVSTKAKGCWDCSKCFPIRANPSWRKARKTRMATEEVDEFMKKLELMPIPELEESSEEESGGWEVFKSRRNVRKERTRQEVCVVEKATKEVIFAGVDQEINMKLRFQVADVKKPLMLVKRIVEQGNHVGFGLGEDDSYILNKNSKHKMSLKSNRKGSYLMQVKLVGGRRQKSLLTVGRRNMCVLGNGKNNSTWWMQTIGCISGMLVEGPSHTMVGGMF